MSVRRLLCLSVALFGALPAFARLGETLAQLTERFGKPEGTPKNTAYWLFESGDSGQLHYTVTFDANKHSMAEGLKPIRNASLTASIAEEFIASEFPTAGDPKSRRVVQPGERYVFGGRALVCAPTEYIVIDEALEILVIWSRTTKTPFVLVLSPAMFQELPAGKK